MALVQANTSFFSGTEQVQAGEVFDDSHEIVRKTPAEWWIPLKVRGVVEEATAKPGAKRRTKAPVEDES